MKIILLGYMGSGKSTVGRLISNKLGVESIDLDDYISDKEGFTITELFSNKGEIYFRKKESEYLVELLTSDKDMVLALGGGTPCYGNNINVINQYGLSFYLEGSLKTLTERLALEKTQRPLITKLNNDQLMEFIGKHLFERNNYYRQAQHHIKIDQKKPATIADEIIQLI